MTVQAAFLAQLQRHSSQSKADRDAGFCFLLIYVRGRAPIDLSRIPPRVSIVVPFFGYPVLWSGSYNRGFGQPKKRNYNGDYRQTAYREHQFPQNGTQSPTGLMLQKLPNSKRSRAPVTEIAGYEPCFSIPSNLFLTL